MSHHIVRLGKLFCALTLTTVGANIAFAQNYLQTNLVSDVSGSAAHTDPNLINAWGLSRTSTSPWWVSDAGSGKATLYDGAGAPNALVVTVPAAIDGKIGTPTGTISNGTTSFEVKPGLPARFLFATADGTISGWNPAADPTNAIIKVKTPKAAYTGMTNAQIDGKPYLYVANFQSGRVEVYDGAFNPVRFKRNAFQLDCDRDDFWNAAGPWSLFHSRSHDPSLLRSLAPFNIQNIGGTLFVAYAQQGDASHHEITGPGIGLVAAFTPEGELVRVFEHGDFLNASWGLALAPGDFGGFSHTLLVGQFGSGEIVAYNITTGEFIGNVLDPAGHKIVIDGLWALSFGNGATAGPLNTLYFTAGPDGETHGLFGSLTPVATTQTQGNSF
jgi:uncharacterized protein (TIGR03118 family)